MTNRSTRLALPLALALALVAPLGCGAEQTVTETVAETQVETETATVTETETETVTETVGTDADADGGPALAQRCENAEGGYSVRYPEGWHTNPGDVSEPCSFFHPEPFELPEQTEAPNVAISISREPVPFGRVAGENRAVRILERHETEIDGRSAVRRETEATGDGLFPEGVRAYQYLVDMRGETLVLSTRDVGDLDYGRNRRILDTMAETLRIR